MPSFEKRDSGLWSVRFTIFDGPDEKQKRLSGFETKREAREAYEKFMAENIVQRKKVVTPVDNFDDLVIAYLQNKKAQVRESSYITYETRIRKHIIPYFSGLKSAKVTPLDVLNWQNSLDLSVGYKKSLRTSLHDIFSFGRRYYKLENPVSDAEGIRDTEMPSEMQVWDIDEWRKFIAVVDDPIYHALFKFLYTSGCRLGEALALSPNDISDRYVSICKSATRITKGGTYKVTAPKNKYSVRKISLPDDMIAELRQFTGKFVFGGDDPLPRPSIRTRFLRYQTAAGVSRIRLHDLRHSHASLLLSHHISVVAVAKRLGHKNATVTLSTYAHMMPSDLMETDAVIAKI